jgi:hypothetical protein
MLKYTKYILLIILCFISKVFSQATKINVAGTSNTLTIANNVSTAVDPAMTVSADGKLKVTKSN